MLVGADTTPAPTPNPSTPEDPIEIVRTSAAPRLKDDTIPTPSATRKAAPVKKAPPKPRGKAKQAETEPQEPGEITEEPGTAPPAKKPRAPRKAPAARTTKRKAATATETEGQEPSTEAARRSTRAKRQRVTTTEDAEEDGEAAEPIDEDEDEAHEEEYDEEDEDDYEEEEADRALNTKPKAKAAPKPKAPRKPRAPRKPKDPSEPRTRRKRAESPADAEYLRIIENVVKMKDLCQDPKTGKKSRRFKELESTDWNEVVRRQRALKAEQATRRDAGELIDETMEQRLARLAEGVSKPMAAPQMRIVDGQIVLDEESLRVDRHQRDALEEEHMEIVEENVHTRLVNSGTWSKREKGDRWEEEATDRFYEALSMFGTDFEMISMLFPGRSRRQIKNKFNCEERKEAARVTQALKHRIAVGVYSPYLTNHCTLLTRIDMGEYSQLAGKQFPDPMELEEELQLLRDEHEAEGQFQKTQAVEMERERQDQANQAMRDAESGIVHEQQGRKKKKKGKETKSGEVVLGISIEEYERQRLRQLEEEES